MTDPAGALVARSGDPAMATFLRSAAKPFQAIPLVADGVVERFGLTRAELAVACASHSSEVEQVAIVAALLRRIGCGEEALACGAHRPLALDLAIRPDDAEPPALAPMGALASNCSGKHAGMLALALAHRWPIAGYERPEHRVQARCRREIARWTGTAESQLVEGVDGCGVVTFQVPLCAAARAFAALGASDDPAARAVREAMAAHPELVGGRYRLCTELMQAYPGDVIAKVGADGVYGVSLPRRGLGVALKVEDGASRAAMVAVLAVLDRLDLEPRAPASLTRFARMPIVNTRGDTTGWLAPAGDLTFE